MIYANNTPSSFLRLDLFDQIGIRNLLSVTNYIHAFGIPAVFNTAAENDGGVFQTPSFGRFPVG